MSVNRFLVGKVTITVALLLAAALSLHSGSPTSPASSTIQSLASPLRDPSRNTAVESREVINVVVDHTTTKTMPRRPATPLIHPNFVPKMLAMTPTGQVGDSLRISIKKCYNTTKNVWLTFDDGYTSQANLDSILGTLRVNNVRGRFFLIASWARQHPSMVSQIVSAGHFVENHTNSHAYLGQIGDSAVRAEIRYGQRPNTHPKLLRPPGGDGTYTVRLYNLAQEQGYLLCGWGTDTRDWSGASAPLIIQRVLQGDAVTPPAKAGDPILLHLSNTQTRYALPVLIKGLRAKGLTLDKLRG